MLAELESYRTADHLVLPFERSRQPPDPLLPIFPRRLLHPANLLAQIADEGLVRAEEEMDVFLHAERALFQDVTDRRIGGEAQRLRPDQIADMVRAVGRFRQLFAPVLHGPQDSPDPRIAGDGANDPAKCDRAIHPPLAFISRREIEHFDRAAILRFQPRQQDRRVADVALRGAYLPFQFEPPNTGILTVAIQQRAEHRIAIDTWHTSPDEAAFGIDQPRNLAIADGP